MYKHEYFILLSLVQSNDLGSKKRKTWSTSCCSLLNIFTKHKTTKIFIVVTKALFTVAAAHKTHVMTGIVREGTIKMPHLILLCWTQCIQELMNWLHEQMQVCFHQRSPVSNSMKYVKNAKWFAALHATNYLTCFCCPALPFAITWRTQHKLKWGAPKQKWQSYHMR